MDQKKNASGYDFILSLRDLGEKYQGLSNPDPELGIRNAWLAASSQLKMSEWELALQLGSTLNLNVARTLEDIDLALLTPLPYSFANGMTVLPLRRENHQVVVAVANPFDSYLEQLLHFVYGGQVRLELAPADAIEVGIAKAYADQDRRKLQASGSSQQGEIEEKEIPRLARQLMEQAVNLHASDMHVQPFVGGSAVRIRVDGLLRRLLILPESVSKALIRYFQARAGMDPTNQLVPQDGSIGLEISGREYDLRVSTLPVAGSGQKLVIRFLTSAKHYDLNTTGLSLLEIQTLRRLATNPSGVVLLCGPTGSGKTTTLYSILAEINKESISITTVEDPVEYRMPGLSQTAVNTEAGMTFAAALRSILRQDPDVILIGEIRDSETAQIAMQSAMTGHLVFSTLHTNDALGAIPRLLDLGVQPAILSQALTGIVSQRLMRRLCEHCRKPADATLTQDEAAFKAVTSVAPPYRATGCEKCGFTGYLGRVVITEMLEINTDLIRAIANGEKDIGVLRAHVHGNTSSMAGSASRRIISGESTAMEATRVLGRPFWIELAEDYGTRPPELSDLDFSDGEQGQHRSTILLVGEEDCFANELQQVLSNAWYDLAFAHTPEQAHKELHNNSMIELVIVDVPDKDDEEEILKYVADYRTAMAWSRLPALLLLTENNPELKGHLKDAGATSQMISKNTSPEKILGLINKALARHADYRWRAGN